MRFVLVVLMLPWSLACVCRISFRWDCGLALSLSLCVSRDIFYLERDVSLFPLHISHWFHRFWFFGHGIDFSSLGSYCSIMSVGVGKGRGVVECHVGMGKEEVWLGLLGGHGE